MEEEWVFGNICKKCIKCIAEVLDSIHDNACSSENH